MSALIQKSRDKIINDVCLTLKKNAKPEALPALTTFAHVFYDTLSQEDLRSRSIEDLSKSLRTLWSYISVQKSEHADIYVYNLEESQYSSPSKYTIIALCQTDMPFLVDSMVMEVNRLGLSVHFVINTGHLYFERDKNQHITKMYTESAPDHCQAEAVVYLEIDYIEDPKAIASLKENLTRVLHDVALAVGGWTSMLEKVKASIHDLKHVEKTLDPDELNESLDFLHWLLNNHFIFMGCRDYRFSSSDQEASLIEALADSGLGVLAEKSTSALTKQLSHLPSRAREVLLSRQILVIAKTNTISTIHRPAYTDYIGIKQFDEAGHVIGFRLLIGLYTSAAYNSSPRHIPFLRKKLASILKLSKLSPEGHSGKALINILETLPRDDLFQATEKELFDLSMGILHLKERQRTRLFVRKDAYNRYFSCFVYLPRDRVDTELRHKIQMILLRELHGFESSFTTVFTESVLARIHYVIRIDAALPNDYDYTAIEEKIIAASYCWIDAVKEHFEAHFGLAQGMHYFNKYRYAFSSGYREAYDARAALMDVQHVERLSDSHQLEMDFYQVREEGQETLQLKLYRAETPSPLSDVLPILENMGFRVIGESPHALHFDDGKVVWVNDFQVLPSDGSKINLDDIADVFRDAFPRVWFNEAENDRFNRLILAAQLSWKETALLRAYARYLKQIGFTFSQDYIADSLYHHPHIAKALINLFMLRFDPSLAKSPQDIEEGVEKIHQALSKVASLDEDRILRRMLALILATLRTNYFLRDNEAKDLSYISLKLSPEAIPDMPLPKPLFEIFVYSPRVEGVHLRGAKVARGGIRWSDRREDFRTEILGLMKAQQVKNAVIVPAGAKGGFVPKMLPTNGDREAILQEAIKSYQIFIRGLLDVTDNIINGKVIAPNNVVRYDEDDPYLVVAADKGTATFSDFANAISASYRFWLDDAFASGGSAGYDHKKIGITARGAWESAKRHFRELLNIDIQTTNFTVIGVGDMSGDVFGNGLLLSRHIRLVAAFNHLHIFIDPNPDAEKSFIERERLFKLPRSSWDDYDKTVLSEGAMIFRRQDKSLTLTPQIQSLLGISDVELSPNELIKAIFRAKVDLFWNGGIGTFVKAETETDAFVGDRANDGIRVNASELGCKVVVEGGNLGFTQKARIEFSQRGGYINTDFIDNSGGVDCSDHEVNLKILLNHVMSNEDLTLKQRNQLLVEMTDEVADLVLKNNYLQTEALSLEVFTAAQTADLLHRYLLNLEKKGRINRKIEGLPTDQEILERKATGVGFSRPEIAVLLAYDKILLKEEILKTDLPEDPYFFDMLAAAFPKCISEKYPEELKKHSLRRELVATQLSSAVINAMGINFVGRLHTETGAPIAFIIRAYIASYELLDLKKQWAAIRALDCNIDPKVQFNLMLKFYFLARRSTRWFLRNCFHDFNVTQGIENFSASFCELKKIIPSLLTRDQQLQLAKRREEYQSQGVPEVLAHEVALSTFMFNALDIIQVARETGLKVAEVAVAYFALGEKLDLNWLREKMMLHDLKSQWDEMARAILLDDIDYYQRILVKNLLVHRKSQETFEATLKRWCEDNQTLNARWSNFLIEVTANPNSGFTMFSVIVRELYELTRIKIAN